MLKRLFPQAKMADYIINDLVDVTFRDDDKPLRVPALIPVVGKFYHWNMGRGKQYRDQ